MKDCIYTILVGGIVTTGIAAITLGARILYDRHELRRLKRSGYRKITAKRYNRGEVDQGFMHGIAELGFLILLLLVVFGWMGFR